MDQDILIPTFKKFIQSNKNKAIMVLKCTYFL